jgi:transcription elongation factor GreA
MALLTGTSYKKLSEELEFRQTQLRKEIAERIREAKELGDLSENAAYKEAQEEALLNEARIQKLQGILREAQILKEPKRAGMVELGSRVIIKRQGENKDLNFLIVSSAEASPSEGKISDNSPLGKALLGKSKGDRIKVGIPNGEAVYLIKEVF